MIEMIEWTPEERARFERAIAEENAKNARAEARRKSVLRFFKFVFFTPLIIALNIMGFVFKACGSIVAIGFPYGLWCVYKVIMQLREGIAFADISQTTFVYLFVIAPFVIFALARACEDIAFRLDASRDR